MEEPFDVSTLPPRNLQILRMWEAGTTSNVISRELCLTRNTVIGVIRRLREKGLVTRRTEVDSAKIALKDAVTGEITVKVGHKSRYYSRTKDLSPRISIPFRPVEEKFKRKPRPAKVAPLTGDEVRLSGLGLFSCRYINGEVDGANTRYCGKRKVRGSYCAEHAELCYYTPVDR